MSDHLTPHLTAEQSAQSPDYIAELIESSSFGDPGARQLRYRTPAPTVSLIASILREIDTAAELRRERRMSVILPDLSILSGDEDHNSFMAKLAGYASELLDVLGTAVRCTGEEHSDGNFTHGYSIRDDDRSASLRALLRTMPKTKVGLIEDATNKPLLDLMEPFWADSTAEKVALGNLLVTTFPLTHDEVAFGWIICIHIVRLDDYSLDIGRRLGRAAANGLSQYRSHRHYRTLSEQLTQALDKRTIIEQAKGFLSGRGFGSVDSTFLLLRRFARTRNMRISEVSRKVVDDDPDTISGIAGRGSSISRRGQ